MIKTPTSWVGVNTQVPNKIVKEALEDWLYPEYELMIPEAKINEKSRLDFALSKEINVDFKKVDLKKGKSKFHFIEVKNVSLVEDGVAKFPDAVTERGQKHLEELMQLIAWGHSTEILFTIQRTDAKSFSAAHEIDPKYAKLLKEASDQGVQISPYLVDLSPTEIKLSHEKLPLVFTK
jgi:sugar fermentation stimulation protein A